MSIDRLASHTKARKGGAGRRRLRLAGWLRDGGDSLLPPDFEGRSRAVRLCLMVVLLAGGFLCASLAIGHGAATGSVSRELLLAAILCLAGAASTASHRLARSLSPRRFRVADSTLPAFAHALLSDEGISLILILDRQGRILRALRGTVAGPHLVECVHLRDRVSVLSALAALRRGAPRTDLVLRAGDIAGPQGMKLKLVAMDGADLDGAVLAVGEALSQTLAASSGAVETALDSAVRDNASKTSLLTAVGQELAVAGRGEAGLPVDLLAGALCYLSRIDAGDSRPAPSGLSIGPLLDDGLKPARIAAARKGLRLAVTSSDRGECVADAEALRLLLGIVFANAVAATPSGEIDIRVATDATGLRVTVTDGGDGLADAADGRPTLNCALLMARSLCETHCGTLHLCSRTGIGTVVDIFIPADCQQRLAALVTPSTENIVSLTYARKKAQDFAPDAPQAPDRRSA